MEENTEKIPEEKKVVAEPEQKPEESVPDSRTPEVNPLDEAKEINKKKEELLNREEKLIERKEKLHAEQMVGGRGQVVPPQKEETPSEYKDRVLRGDLNE